jgi:hypothetical protein
MPTSLARRIEQLESVAGLKARCPQCGRPADAAELHRRDPHSPEAEAEQRRLRALSPEAFREEYRAGFGHYPEEQPPPIPDTKVFQPQCWRCGAAKGPATTMGALRKLPPEELNRYMREALWS